LAGALKGHSVNAVYFGEEKGELYGSFWRVAHGLKAFNFISCDGACAHIMGIEGNTGVMLHRDFDEPFLDYHGKTDVNSLS
jgi:hypothetical protein